MSLIKLENVNFSYDKKQQTIKNISFEVQKGEYLAIIGHNGSGKSTLAKNLPIPTKVKEEIEKKLTTLLNFIN